MSDSFFKTLGMSLFITAVAAFFSLTFFVNTTFDNKDIKSLLEPKNEYLANLVSQLPEQPPVLMIRALNDTFDKYNQIAIKEKGISKEKRANFLESFRGDPSKLDSAYIESFFGKGTFLSKKMDEYTGWMMGRNWSSFDDFSFNLKSKMDGANQAASEEYGLSSGSRSRTLLDIMLLGSPNGLKTGWWGLIIFGMGMIGGFIYFIPVWRKQPGIHNDHIYHNKGQTRKWPAIIVFICLVGFYIVIYEFPYYFSNQISLVKPLSERMSGIASNQWFLYGFLYTLFMFTMGVRMFVKYRGNIYQQVRTCSVFFFQVAFAFTLPQIMTRLQMPAYDLKSAWPLEYSFFFDFRIDEYLKNGQLGMFLMFWGIILFAVGVPVLTYFYGKRWYCSWVCGCGGLAETAGDPYRHLSDKKLGAWKFERWIVHSVLVFAVLMTVWVLYTSISGDSVLLGINSYSVRSTYGFFIGFVFAGAVGTGLYPILGNRTWCRFGCPLAAYLGFVQRFKSRFRITTNGGQCISCGNCSTQCEMGIDVRWYAQRGQNIVRSSCVGCGICAAVCPRGVLNLENKSEAGRINDNPILIGNNGATLNI